MLKEPIRSSLTFSYICDVKKATVVFSCLVFQHSVSVRLREKLIYSPCKSGMSYQFFQLIKAKCKGPNAAGPIKGWKTVILCAFCHQHANEVAC